MRLMVIVKKVMSTNESAWDFTSSDSKHVSGQRSFSMSALKSPVIIMFLCVARNGAKF